MKKLYNLSQPDSLHHFLDDLCEMVCKGKLLMFHKTTGKQMRWLHRSGRTIKATWLGSETGLIFPAVLILVTNIVWPTYIIRYNTQYFVLKQIDNYGLLIILVFTNYLTSEWRSLIPIWLNNKVKSPFSYLFKIKLFPSFSWLYLCSKNSRLNANWNERKWNSSFRSSYNWFCVTKCLDGAGQNSVEALCQYSA